MYYVHGRSYTKLWSSCIILRIIFGNELDGSVDVFAVYFTSGKNYRRDTECRKIHKKRETIL